VQTLTTREPLSQKEQALIKARLKAVKDRRVEDVARSHAEAAKLAQDAYEQASECLPSHPYLQRKGITPQRECRQDKRGVLLIPLRDQQDRLQSLQKILPDGTKRFFPGGKIQGGRLVIAGDDTLPLCLCEGYATGISIHRATGCSVGIAFSAGNLLPVAKGLRDQNPMRDIIICADNDKSDIGQYKGSKAAIAIKARLVVPSFASDEGSDFNDLQQQTSLDEVRRQIMEPEVKACSPNTVSPALKAMGLGEFLALELPKREYLLYPVLPVQGLVIAYAPRGLGKTFVALSMALAVACGATVFNWQAPHARSVLYLDGEMPAHAMQERLSGLLKGFGFKPPSDDSLRIITPDIQTVSMPDLTTRDGQEAVEPFLSGVALVVIDNLATLCRTGKENEAQSWQPVQTWFLALRRRGISVLVIHHAGKSGDQRGTSAKEDIMDTVISLRRPEGYEMSEGARLEVHLTKARGIAGEVVKPFEIRLDAEGDALRWTTLEIHYEKEEQLKALLAEGYSIREAAKEMGITKSAAHRLKQKMEN